MIAAMTSVSISWRRSSGSSAQSSSWLTTMPLWTTYTPSRTTGWLSAKPLVISRLWPKKTCAEVMSALRSSRGREWSAR